MSFGEIFRWILFCAGIITSIFAGYMFYIDNIAGGAAWLAMAVGFLCFATRVKNSNDEDENNSRTDKELHDMALLIADIAVISLKKEPAKREIEDLEVKLNNFLDIMPLDKPERDEIHEKFSRIKSNFSAGDKGRAFFNQLKL